MRRNPIKRIGAVAGILCAATLLTITQASAISAEIERATDTNGPSSWDSWECTASGTSASDGWKATSCYSALGDWLRVSDFKSDGYSAVMDWEIRDAQNRIVRYGATFNADGVGAARYKNKDFPDSNSTIRMRTCLGHWSTKMITAGTCSAWMTRQT